jgi:hypothetical protein
MNVQALTFCRAALLVGWGITTIFAGLEEATQREERGSGLSSWSQQS